MKNLKVSSKLMAGFSGLLIMAIIVGSVGVISSVMFRDKVKKLHKLNEEHQGIVGVTESHYIWRHNLVMAVSTESEFAGSTDPDGCALGKWLAGDVAKGIEDSEVLRILSNAKVPHEFIHKESAIVVEHMNNGDFETARQVVYDTILPKTQDVINFLSSSQERVAILVDELDDEIAQLSKTMSVVIPIILGVAVLVAVLLSRYISGMISKPISLTADFFRQASTTGEITCSAEVDAMFGRFKQN
ncbi:MAG: hypothetical protein FWG83_03205, partial [Oscillospiraceae bacterium]|nr:hypothetical protein [Oscillospiraceae bacterium]